ncbi:MAG: glycosyltransferase [Microcoleus sp. PH2017_07_MST_O_A]|uniref:glycosyltransferase family 4 protein n=1 Tax=Microcoleus sp. PH2017_05_CCC_O_A TaxID=2798816 RepID=UPI001D807406|nr:glycosyltransferase family 4 protein [Microcoleus sp. PH2017_05_CCC_O_A]MCC3420213.1 glycosyltransferase [Microcoleus sp. PH2017_07_MST_O_A]MCC3509557.1 glycosyltransferase [Microcoleus sp. PH2017_17_BER_D_A]TAE65885.1 MAG: glycosyltransferase [Oscillatoriales cyanobacterium]MCC3437338.1 glycosyltransferase [Microcoleus sp. PH2017_05_CCC_O_A]TAF95352.1 MAG: glycosyltransferase [Oscillatoriales cyanobacterium]
MRILMLSSTFPYPPSRGGTQVRTFNLLQYLSRRHDVILGTVRSPDVTDSQIDALRQQVTQLAVFLHPQTPPQPPLAKGGLRLNQETTEGGFFPPPLNKETTEGGFFPPPLNKGGIDEKMNEIIGKFHRFSQFLLSGTPPNVISSYSQAMQNWADNLVIAGKCDAVTCEHSVNEIYVRPEWRQKLLTVANIHSSVWGTCREMLATGTSQKPLRDRLNLPLLARYEKRYCTKFSRIVATTSTDKQQLLELLSSGSLGGKADFFVPPIDVIPNGVDLAEFPYRSIDPGGHTLIFAGAMNNLPNIDAARFLSLQVLPKLQQRYPDATLTLVGTSPVPEVLALGKLPGIQVVGRVQRVAEYLHQAAVCVVPMRIGFGIKNKTLEAMAAGTPVVASDRGLEGLTVGGGPSPTRALRANEVQEYVEAITSLFENYQLRQELSLRARSLVESQYTWDIIGRQYDRLFQI